MNRRGTANVTGGHVGEHFQGAPRDCGPCPLRAQYLRTPGTTPVRNVAFCRDRVGRDVNDSALMRDRIDASAGRAQYARTSASIVLPCAAVGRSMRRGSCRASCTTSRSSRTTDTPPDDAHHTDWLRPRRLANVNLARNPLPAASRSDSLALKRARMFANACSYSFNAGFCSGRSNTMRAERASEDARLQQAPLGRRHADVASTNPPPSVATLSVGVRPPASPADGLRRALRARVRPVAPRGRAGDRPVPRLRHPRPRVCAQFAATRARTNTCSRSPASAATSVRAVTPSAERLRPSGWTRHCSRRCRTGRSCSPSPSGSAPTVCTGVACSARSPAWPPTP